MKRNHQLTKMDSSPCKRKDFSTFQLFKLSTLLLALASTIQAMAEGECFTYRGKLAKPDGSSFDTSLAMEMTFNLYHDKTKGIVLWGRKVPVRMAEDGSFSVELYDEAGSHVSGAAYTNLTDALGYQVYAKEFYIGLTPGSSSELSPRLPVNIAPRALSASTAMQIETMRAPSIEADSLIVQSAATVASLNVPKNFVQRSGSAELETPANTVQELSAESEINVTHSIQNIKSQTYQAAGDHSAATTDTFLIRNTGDGWYSLVIPFGATPPAGSDTLETSVTFGE